MSTECVCGTPKQPLCTDDVAMNDCLHCKDIDMYEPCPNQGHGCGSGCDCCTPEQQASVDEAAK